jgi:hypothetical protein
VRKYFFISVTVFFSFIGVLFLLPQKQITYAAGGADAVCTGNPGTTGSCNAGLICTAPDLGDPAIVSECTKTRGKALECQNTCQLPAPGEACTGACGTGETCEVNNPQQCTATQKDGDKEPAIQAACGKVCKLERTQGQSCGTNGQAPCFAGLMCYANKCIQPAQSGQDCTTQLGGNVQGSCADGLTCKLPGQITYNNDGTPNTSCNLHTGLNCSPVQEGNTLGGGTCVNPSVLQRPTAKNPTEGPQPPLPPCKQWGANGVCETFNTTFGGFSTNPIDFIQKIFAILLSVSGGIALLLIIKAGYQLMTSQGNPEKLNNGRDQLIAAIVGLVFLIFSFVFLELIGFDILHLPGFGGTAGGAGVTAQSCNADGLQYCAASQQCYPQDSTCP